MLTLDQRRRLAEARARREALRAQTRQLAQESFFVNVLAHVERALDHVRLRLQK